MKPEIVKAETYNTAERPSRAEAEEAVRTLIRWAGDDPAREGLIDTPARVTRAYEEFFAGYARDAKDDLSRTFEDIQGFDDMVIVKNIDFTSHCEHHMVPIIGRAHVAYWPDEKVVGISKLARVVDICSKRLVSQETMTQQVVNAIEGALSPKGVAVIIEAAHQCMSIRGVNKADSLTVTSLFTGKFRDDVNVQRRFLDLANSR
ncbi:MAG: GTP cyclohydrolase I FolE [Alphaproteobacteria bacterium]|nr:GTP cyclohydrolase I FolE [Alphaproteobacteria bacterium]